MTDKSPPTSQRSEHYGMSEAELRSLPVVVSLETANRALSIGRSTGYALARTGDYPVRVLRLGKQYRVTRADLMRFVGIDSRTGPEDLPK